MRYMKKVGVTPIPENEGKIIDSFNTTDDKHTNAPSLNAVMTRMSEVANRIISQYVVPGDNNTFQDASQYADNKFNTAKTYTDTKFNEAKSYIDGKTNVLHYIGSFSTAIMVHETGAGVHVDNGLMVNLDFYKAGNVLRGNIDIISPFGGSEIEQVVGSTSDTIDISTMFMPKTLLQGYAGETVNVITSEQYKCGFANLASTIGSLSLECIFSTVTPQSNGHFVTIPVCLVCE